MTAVGKLEVHFPVLMPCVSFGESGTVFKTLRSHIMIVSWSALTQVIDVSVECHLDPG